MPDELADKNLIAAFRQGDGTAADRLFERYYDRLMQLARGQLGLRMRAVEESSDVVQSVLHSFFQRTRRGEIEIGEDESLWPLLVTVTLNKIRDKARYWKRQRRDVERDVALLDHHDPLERVPSPDDVAELKESISLMLAQFSERRQRILQLILEDHSVKEIAAMVGSSERTVYNTRQAAAKALQVLFEQP